MIERTLVVVKHDGVLKGLIGEITRRFEQVGLSIVGLKMIWADEQIADQHYQATPEWATGVFEKAKSAAEKDGRKFPFHDAHKYGQMIKDWNKKFLREGPVVAMVIEGPHAVELGRKIVGHTEPRQALPGTIRGDYSHESYQLSDALQRPVRNLVHASGSTAEAEREIQLWFKKAELHAYKRP